MGPTGALLRLPTGGCSTSVVGCIEQRLQCSAGRQCAACALQLPPLPLPLPLQGGHAAPVSWLLPLPCGLHVLTAACDGEAKLWVAAAADGSVAGTLLPAATEREESTLRCRPALASDGSWVVCGSPSGTLACWDLQAVQRSAHLPPGGAAVNAAAACRPHGAAVTAVAVGLGDTLLCSGDATGRLLVRWR